MKRLRRANCKLQKVGNGWDLVRYIMKAFTNALFETV